MKQRVKQLAITEKSVKKKKIVAVVIIMFIFSIIILGVGSKLVFQKICERRETAWPDLGTADDEQYEWLTEAYKIKQKNNEKIVILASDGTKLEGHYSDREAAIILQKRRCLWRRHSIQYAVFSICQSIHHIEHSNLCIQDQKKRGCR